MDLRPLHIEEIEQGKQLLVAAPFSAKAYCRHPDGKLLLSILTDISCDEEGGETIECELHAEVHKVKGTLCWLDVDPDLGGSFERNVRVLVNLNDVVLYANPEFE